MIACSHTLYFLFKAVVERSRTFASLASSPIFSKRTKRKIKQRLCTGYVSEDFVAHDDFALEHERKFICKKSGYIVSLSVIKRVQDASRQAALRERPLDKSLFVLACQKSLVGAIKVLSCTSAFVSSSAGKINRFVYHLLCQW